MKKYLILFFTFILIFCGKGEKKIVSGEPEQHLTSEENHHQELKVSLEKQKQWGIEVAEIPEIAVSSKITLPGVLTLNQNKTAEISSFAQGKILSLSADLGDNVHKGQVLLTINSPEFAQAQADFLQARAKFKLSHKEFERANMLLKEKAIEQKEFLRREAEYEKASTEVGVRGSNLHSFGLDHDQIDALIKKCESLDPEGYLCEVANPNLNVLSPINGRIIFRDVIVGEHIEPKKILFTVSDLTTLWASLDAYEKDLPYLDRKSRVTIRSSFSRQKDFEGKIIYISDMIDEKLRTAKVRVEVQNKEYLLKPNMYIEGIIENTAETKKLLAVPEDAIQSMNGEKIVFVMEEENVIAAREVEVGDKIDTRRVILKGIRKGEKIVIKGAFNLKAELTKESFGRAHVH